MVLGFLSDFSCSHSDHLWLFFQGQWVPHHFQFSPCLFWSQSSHTSTSAEGALIPGICIATCLSPPIYSCLLNGPSSKRPPLVTLSISLTLSIAFNAVCLFSQHLAPHEIILKHIYIQFIFLPPLMYNKLLDGGARTLFITLSAVSRTLRLTCAAT